MFNFIAKVFANIYNAMSPRLRVVVFIFTSGLAAGFLKLIIVDLVALNYSNQYIKLFVDNFVWFIGMIINIIQLAIADKGTDLLAAEKDPKTIKMINEKIDVLTDKKNP